MSLREKFLEGMSLAAATVSVITTDGPAGRHGVTVSAMTSVSADSTFPSLLVCVNRSSAAAEAIRTNGVFCVNILNADQTRLSDVFAGRYRDQYPDKFEFGEWKTLHTGAPVACNALAVFDCHVKNSILHGSHWVIIGEADAIDVDPGMSTLIYANRSYARPTPLVTRKATNASDKSLVVGCSTNWGPVYMGAIAAAFSQAHPDVNMSVVERAQQDLVTALKVGDIDCAITHDLNLPDSLVTHEFAHLEPYCLLPAENDFEGRSTVDLADLADIPMILLDSKPVTDILLGRFSALGLTPRVAFRARTFEMVRSLVGNGLGFAIVFTRASTSAGYDGKYSVSKKLAKGSLPAMSLVLAHDREPQSEIVELFTKMAINTVTEGVNA